MNLKRHKNKRQAKTKSKNIQILEEYIKNNIKEYIIIIIIFLLGLFLGVMFINNVGESQKQEITGYVNTYLEAFKQKEIDYSLQLKNNIRENIILVITMWFAGSTVIGIPIVLGIIAFRGFCLGYAIASFTYVLGTTKGITFSLVALIIQNIIFIPAIISLGVSCLKLYQSILKDKRRENVKIEIIRHTIFSIIMLILIIISAILEAEISTRILKTIVKYI
ncbi:MAG: stage II sporulation protein M [Clostridia bacterium]|nr:stage II sporulation protein M [Clostridia bacterium]